MITKNKKPLILIVIILIIIFILFYYNRNIIIKEQYKQTKENKYNRGDWGRWIDEDKDGLNTRNEVLLEESLIKPIIKNGVIVSGKWYDKYTGKYFTNPKDLDIDHLVPLKNAYISGASNWSKKRKINITII